MYFDNFPTILYSFDNENILTLTQIFNRFKIVEAVKENSRTYDTYKIKDGETPDGLSQKVYGTPEYHWVILLFNDIIDPFGQWPMDEESLRQFIISKYGQDHLTDIKHYLDEKGNIVDPNSYSGVISGISNYDYETRVNDSKRKIFLPKKIHVSNIIRQVEELLKSS